MGKRLPAFIASFAFILASIGSIASAADFMHQDPQAIAQVDPFAMFQEGDLIFHKSQSRQAAAIIEATGSEWSHVGIVVKNKGQWFVAEAIQPATATPIKQWIARGKNQEFKVFRNPDMKPALLPNLYSILKTHYGMTYDIYFEWNNDRIYCSELVYKVFERLTGQGVGQIQKVKELKLDGPAVQELIRIRLTDLGKELNLEEDILTPISQMNDPRLEEVETTVLNK